MADMKNELEKRGSQDVADDLAILAAIREGWASQDPEARAYTIIRDFLEIENPGEELHRKFMDWLKDGRNAEAKDRAYFTLFQQAAGVDGDDGAGEQG
jgi:type IV secretory pathway VirB4 component